MLMTGERVKLILALVLAIGNYLNGGTQRGQADGFGLDILAKLKDVKSKDNSQHLLQYVVTQYVRRHDVDAQQQVDKMLCPVPEAADLSKAALVNFDDVAKEIQKLRESVTGRREYCCRCYHWHHLRLHDHYVIRTQSLVEVVLRGDVCSVQPPRRARHQRRERGHRRTVQNCHASLRRTGYMRAPVHNNSSQL